MPFQNERPISQHDLIEAAELSMFEEFDHELQDAGHSETRADFSYTEVPVSGGRHLIARPNPGFAQKVWVHADGDSWYEDASVDASGRILDASGQPVGQVPAPGTAGTCVSCGASTALPNGTTAVYCPSCGDQQPSFSVPLISPHTLAGKLAAALGNQCMACGNQSSTLNQAGVCPSCAVAVAAGTAAMPPLAPPPPPNYNPNRMLGNQKPQPVIPEGLGKSDGKEDFFAFLDEAIEAGKDNAPTETPVKE